MKITLGRGSKIRPFYAFVYLKGVDDRMLYSNRSFTLGQNMSDPGQGTGTHLAASNRFSMWNWSNGHFIVI